jgi:hypothetical protein
MKTLKKLLFSSVFITLFIAVCMINNALAQPKNAGEPVPGAEVYVELTPDHEDIATVETNNDGEIIFKFPDGIKIPKEGVFALTITPPKKIKSSKSKKLTGMQKQTILIPFKKKEGPKFKYILLWKEGDAKTYNRGSFAVSGKSQT